MVLIKIPRETIVKSLASAMMVLIKIPGELLPNFCFSAGGIVPRYKGNELLTIVPYYLNVSKRE
jgi:hypothetical protein